ncbi:MAG: hypothetical protein RL637_1018 [Pseudomonadota bacterium]|jgi:lactate dehydrogenase-like 2-hydroxyacid dehydrogenase
MTAPIKILITRRWPAQVEAQLQQNYQVTLNKTDQPLTKEQLKSALQHYDAICPTVCDSLPAEIFNISEILCKILGNFGVGYNHIDLQAAKAAGITVTNTPDVLTESTADIAMTLLLMSARRGAEGDRLVRAGEWTGWCPTHMMSSDVTGATLGIIGFGRIGQAMARKAHFGFQMPIIYHHPRQINNQLTEITQAYYCETLAELMQKSDFVSLHCPGGIKTRHLINAETLSWMKSTAHLINTARGDVVDSQALIQHLRLNKIAGAGLDVYENEPNLNRQFLTLHNVTLLPHLGSATIATRTAMGLKVLDNLADFFAGKMPKNRVI